MSGSRERSSSKRGRNIHHSGSTSNFNASQEVVAPSQSTPSFNYASSRCMDDVPPQDLMLAETGDIDVKPIRLETRDGQRYLLLEDVDTGDVLMPLTKLKDLLGDNYSRALNNTDNRLVIKNTKLDFGPHDTTNNLYWMWPFESPSHVKSLIKRELQDYSPGHIRLVLVPVVYNALNKIHQDARSKKKADARLTPAFLGLEEALERNLYNSSYAPLLHLPIESGALKLREDEKVAFAGPKDIAFTAAKYMSTHKVISRKKAKLEARSGLAAAVSKQELVAIAKQETAGISELQAQMQRISEQVKSQDKRLEQLSEDLRETRSLFTRIMDFLNPAVRAAPPSIALPQVHSVPDMEKPWQVDQFGRYLLPPRSKSAAAAQGFTHLINAPAVSTGVEHHFVANALQPMACPQFLSLTQQLAQLPGQNASGFPTVANAAHHLVFPDPQTPGSHDPAAPNPRGINKTYMAGASLNAEQLKPNSTYEDYVRHVFPFKQGIEPRQDDVTNMF